MRADTRGLANGIIGFVAVIVVVALLYTLMTPAFTGVTDSMSDHTTDADAQGQIDQANRIWTAMPLVGLFLAALLVLGRATFESGGPR